MMNKKEINNKNTYLEDVDLTHPKALEWLESRPYGETMSDLEWVKYCAQWEGYVSKENK